MEQGSRLGDASEVQPFSNFIIAVSIGGSETLIEVSG